MNSFRIQYNANLTTKSTLYLSLSLSLTYHSEGCEWHTFKDWIKEDIRQILVETHELPLENQVRQTEFGKIPMMGATDYFDAFEENGFVMFAKEINSPNWNGIGGRCSEWSYIKMAPEFLDMQNSTKHGRKSAASASFRLAAANRLTSGNEQRSSLLKKPLPRGLQSPTTPTTPKGFGAFSSNS
jgi:hypothetical protein